MEYAIFVACASLVFSFLCGIVSGSWVRCEQLGVVKVKVPVLSVVVVGGDKRGTQKMDENEWMYESIMSEQADIDYENEEACGANESHVDCSDAFNTSEVFECREDVLRWARFVAHENEFVAVILRSNTNIGSRGRTSFLLISCERSGEYRRDTETRKCGCPFKLCCKLVVGGEGWMVKLICGVHNHELANSLVGHPYAGQLTKAEKHLLIKDEDVVRDIFWCHPDAVNLVNACNLIQHLQNNWYRLSLLDFVWVTPTEMTFSACFAYVKGESVNNLVWALQRVFPDGTNLLCIFNINKNVKAKCKSLIGQKNVWDYVMDCWGCLTDCPSEQQFDECLKKFEMACSP
ncbi:hypothetical protein HKD37_18G051680 [Glycine soja]